MAAAANTQAFAPVLAALATMSSTGNREQKSQAHAYLEEFQKSPEAWTSTFAMLQSADATDEAKLFAATTLKGKVIYDFHQIPKESHLQLRDSLLSTLASYAAGPKPIRTQLCVCLANLSLLMLEWKDVLPTIMSSLGSNTPAGISCILEFLHVLPEEVTEGKKINLAEDELRDRTTELLEQNGQNVVQLLTQYAQSSPDALKNPLLMSCITSWIREVPLPDIINSPLLDVVMAGFQNESSFDASVETLCAIFRETRDVDENMDTIKVLYPRLASLVPRIKASADEEDWEVLKGVTRVFAEAGEAWVMLVLREPAQFRDLVESILQCCIYDKEREALSQTFQFWYELKQYITIERYMEARLQYVDVYSKLVDIMIVHLQYPIPEDGNTDDKDLFDGDREAEDRFREFRHELGDVLKDCCEVIGVTECLRKSYDLIEKWVGEYGPQASNGRVPFWQKLEAPLFSLRAMGKQVSKEENIMLPRLIPLIVQIPDQEKVRFQAIMALGRYTEWTAQHPETLQDQFNFILAAFSHSSQEVVKAAALALKFFCADCADLLKDYMPQLQQFYEANLDALGYTSQEEITEGVAAVVARQPLETLHQAMKLCCDPICKRLVAMAQTATEKEQKIAIADYVGLLTQFIEIVTPYVEPSKAHPAVQYCGELFPVLGALVERFIDFIPIVERVCRCWRYMVLSYRTHTAPLLPQLAEKLSAGFTASRQGCFLWATDSIVREFSDVSDYVSRETTDGIYIFYEQQATTFLRALNDLPPEDLPDVIEDFFRLSDDVLLYHPQKLLASQLLDPILSAATTSLTLLKEEPLRATLHFLRDFLAYGSDAAPPPSFDAQDGTYNLRPNPPQVKMSVLHHITTTHGNPLVQRCMTGMMYSFPSDCIPDASGVLLALFQLVPRDVAGWVANTVDLLPAGSIGQEEKERLMRRVGEFVEIDEPRKIRTLLQDFTGQYRRRNVAPREGLGGLEGGKFRFQG